MSSSRLAVFMLVLSTPPAFAAGHINCPRTITVSEAVHTLSNARVFLGAVTDKVEVTPIHGNFDLSGIERQGSGKPLTLVCIYGGTDEVQTLAVPTTATACDIADAGSGTLVSCH